MWGRGRSSGDRRVLAPGDTVGRYEVIRPLAKGGMAELYLGRARGIEGFEKLVVLKCIRQEYQHEGEFIRMFLDEARLAATLSHPNIAQVFDVDRSHGTYFFAMEYVDGRDVAAIRKAAALDGQLALEHVLAIGVGVTAALHYAHQLCDSAGRPRAIVHRDVSPSNVLVSYDGAVKLVDFGIARAAGRLATTRDGTLKGKVRYMSPEQCAGQDLDGRSDIFSLGVLMYELTTNQVPFTAEADVALAHRIATEDAPPPSSRVASYPPDLEAIVMRALSRDREARYASAQAMQLDLEKLATDLGVAISPVALASCMKRLFPARSETLVDMPPIPEHATRSTQPASPHRARRQHAGSRRWLISSALAVVGIGAVGYAVLAGRSDHAAPPAEHAATSVSPVLPPSQPPDPPPPAPAAAPQAEPPIVTPSRAPTPARGRPRHAAKKPAPTTPPRQRLPEGDDAPLP